MTTASPSHAETITPIAEAARGTAAMVRGAVARVLDDDVFRRADASGSVVVHLDPEPAATASGERLTIRGRVDDDWPRKRHAREIGRANGDMIALLREERA